MRKFAFWGDKVFVKLWNLTEIELSFTNSTDIFVTTLFGSGYGTHVQMWEERKFHRVNQSRMRSSGRRFQMIDLNAFCEKLQWCSSDINTPNCSDMSNHQCIPGPPDIVAWNLLASL